MDKASSLPWLDLSMKYTEDVLFINIKQEGKQHFWNPSIIVMDKMSEGIKKSIDGKSLVPQKKR